MCLRTEPWSRQFSQYLKKYKSKNWKIKRPNFILGLELWSPFLICAEECQIWIIFVYQLQLERVTKFKLTDTPHRWRLLSEWSLLRHFLSANNERIFKYQFIEKIVSRICKLWYSVLFTLFCLVTEDSKECTDWTSSKFW